MNTKETNPKDICGIKKAPMSTVSAPVLAEVGVAMLEGGLKYGRHNYRAVGVRASVYYDATMRHLFAWWEGEDIDPDSGMPHIVKAITSLVVLRDAILHDKCEDDRPPSSGEFYPALNAIAAELVDKYADRNPKHYTIADSSPTNHENEFTIEISDWIKNTGVIPDCKLVQVEYNNGVISDEVYEPEYWNWQVGDNPYCIAQYRVIK